MPIKKYSELVYKVSRKDCNNRYIGETIQLLSNRSALPNNDVKFEQKCTALCKHNYETGHSSDFEGTSIVCFEKNEMMGKLGEAIEIVKQRNSINYKTDNDKVNVSYSPVFARTRRHRVCRELI
jgi:hypothetical protein